MPFSICTITGAAYFSDGDPANNTCYLEADLVTKNGVVIDSAIRKFYAHNGVITLTLPRGSTARLTGTIRGFEQALTLAIPDAETANLEDLAVAATVPTTGIVVQDDGVAGADKVGTFNFGAGLAVSYPSPGIAKVDAIPAVNAQTGTTYTFLASDNGKIVTFNNAGAITATVPAGLGAGFNCLCVQLGAGLVSFLASGVTLNNRQGFVDSAGQYAVMSLVSYAANIFVLGGDLA